MATMVVQHEVREYGAWRPLYDKVEGLRAQYGCTAQRVWRSPEDSNNLFVLHDFPTIDQARAFASSAELKEAMLEGGVSSVPRFEIWEDVEA